ncbi:hypothetical protein [Pseudonocardia humida]|uniref:YbaB/EbfC DNA-binding family protein n=1 Tax=Pseudonocardia humida TaxID=2800819 RepID=A0ABT1A355_9PSEU|nr:hypothetical protein [Pseudonocardia humida]MCO1657420.1 hypothetical protein [Pseudonocardia humida]
MLHASGADARLELLRGWRPAVGPDGLGPAVLEAFRVASLARLAAWAADHPTPDAPRAAGTGIAPGSAHRPVRPAAPPTREAVAELGRAFRDLREFSLQLTALMRTPRTVSGPGRAVLVQTLGGQIVDLTLDPAWRRAAIDSDLEHRITAALRTALQQCAAMPAQALEGCPDLVAVLVRNPAGSPFAPPADPRGGR